MKELVIISGKGGTGKTSVVASFAALAENKVLADCDVDAADLHLILSPSIRQKQDFSSAKEARILAERCTACGRCAELCRFGAIASPGENGDAYRIDPISCEGCGVCARFCPSDAIDFGPVVNGEWFISDTRHGPFVHARLGIAQENSGKLVTLVRNQARRVAEERGLDLIIADGSPGIGCPVIASVGGADLVLVVTEPTLSAIHDMKRACQLARHFQVHPQVCINKCDLNTDMTASIEHWCESEGIPVLGKIPYDPVVTKAQVAGLSVVEFARNGLAQQFKALWQRTIEALGES